MRKLVLALMVAAVSWASVARADEQSHDGGFFLRFSPGFGYFSTKYDDGQDEVKFKGGGGGGDIAIGYGVAPNFFVHATIFGSNVFSPTVEFNGQEEGDLNDLSLTMAAIGGGVTYYLGGDANIFVSASVGAASLTAESSFVSAETDTGLGFEIMAGKEWWVGDKWAIGIGAGVTAHSVPDAYDEKLSGTSFDLRFSATMN